MRSAELLARLNAKTQSFNDGRGGIPELTQADIAASCAGLGRPHYVYALLAFVHAQSWQEVESSRRDGSKELFIRIPWDQKHLFSELMTYLIGVLRTGHPDWFNPEPDSVWKATSTALRERLDPKSGKCRKCKGSGHTSPGKACRSCGGSGFKKIKGVRYAEEVGVHRANWTRTWERRYEMIYRMIGDMESEIARHIARRLELYG